MHGLRRHLATLAAPLIPYMPAFPRVWGMTVYYHRQRKQGFPEVRGAFRNKLDYELNLETPRSFNEKLTHRKLYCRDPVWIQVTDKVAVRDWLQRKGLVGADLKLIPVLGIFRTPGALRRARLPRQYIAKAAWASGRNFIVKDHAADLPRLIKAVTGWLAESPVYQFHLLIWASWHIPRRIIVEELLVDDQGNPPADYKFFVFHGRVRFFQIDYERFQGHRRNLYDRDKALLKVEHRIAGGDAQLLPDTIDQMITVAERIGAHFDFARIDLYGHAGQIYFGEITMTPADGRGPFRPQEFDVTAGEYWNYPMVARAKAGAP